MIDRETVAGLLSYESDTGVLRWLVSQGAVRAGKEAGTAHSDGYILVQVNGHRTYAHRLAWLLVHGTWPEEIDHVNGVRNDNRLVNLRSVDVQTNRRNTRRGRANTSGHVGVYFHKNRRKWIATVRVDNRQRHLGCFEHFGLACLEADYARAQLGFDVLHGKSADERAARDLTEE